MKVLGILGVVVVLATAFAAKGGPADVDVFERLRKSIKRLDSIGPQVPSWRDQVVPLWTDMDKSVAVLQEFAQEHSMQDQYRQDITNMSFIFDEFERKSHSTGFWGAFQTGLLDTCNAADKDLNSKVKHAEQHASEPFITIRVTVRTLRNEKEVSGYEVWYVPVAWENEKNRFQCYKKQSSPTSDNLNPGYYKMWSEKNGQSSRRKPVTVEDDKADPVDLTVPPE